jgi:hypothetical protein
LQPAHLWLFREEERRGKRREGGNPVLRVDAFVI